MRALVTGGAGFIGSHLIEGLLKERDCRFIRVVDNFFAGSRKNLEPYQSRIELIEGDLTESSVCQRAVADVDVVFHEAAIPSVARSVANPFETHLNGVHLTLSLLDCARQAGVRRFVFAGSSSSYGDSEELPKREEIAPRPCSPYAATKVACEQYLRAYSKCYAIDTVSLRYFNVFGPRQNPSSPYSGVIARFCEAAFRQSPLTIFGDGEQSRDFTYVANVVNANLLAARHPTPLQGEVFNIGSGVRTTLNDLVSAFEEISGRHLVAEHHPTRVGDVLHSLASIEKAQNVFGYRPTVSLRDGLKQTYQWYRAMAEQCSEARLPAFSR